MSDADANADSPDAASPDAPTPGISYRKVGLLSVLYFVQGLPFGFLIGTLAPHLYRTGMPVAKITFITTVVNWPWLIKFVWAPLADRYYLPSVGRRRSWIIPAQLGLFVSLFVTGLMVGDLGLAGLVVMLSVVNLFAATQDIAVDGLAVDILDDHERGIGNSVQAAAYKIGMVGGAFGLSWALEHLGFGLSGCFYVMSGAVAIAMIVPLLLREPPVSAEVEQLQAGRESSGPLLSTLLSPAGLRRSFAAGMVFTILLHFLLLRVTQMSWPGILLRALPIGLGAGMIFHLILEQTGSGESFGALFTRRGAIVFFGMVMLAKAGDSIANPLFRVMLLGAGRTWDEVNFSMNVGGMAATLLGSAICGYVIIKLGRRAALWITIIGQGLSHFGWVFLALAAPYYLFGDQLTTVMRCADWSLSAGFADPVWWALSKDGATVSAGFAISLEAVWAIALLEHFVSGMLTVVIFTLMMDAVRPEVGGGQYTLLMSLYGTVGVVLGMASGQIVELGGYHVAFGAAGVITLLCLLLIPALSAGGYLTGRRPPAAPGD